jgi:transposase
MEQPTTIGIDLAKTVFQVHGVNQTGKAILKRKLRRNQVLDFFAGLEPCLVGLEACAGAHYWARELSALGHEVRIMPPSYVKPYVKRGKTDAADAEAICEAVTRPTMRFVPVKSAERQAALLNHKTRDFLVRQRTQLVNTIRAHLSEFGIVVAKGIHSEADQKTAWGAVFRRTSACSRRQRTCPRRRGRPSTCSQTSCARRRKRSMT